MSEELSCKSSLDVPLLPQWNHLDEKANIASHHSTKNTIVSLFAPALMDSMQYQVLGFSQFHMLLHQEGG
ncbi:hypothetical protein JHK82_049807 [Glycine max]|nr:hypothetical protein JHK86_049682 [Glycine max]KAG4935510.1 hypothetical protein JHK85_050429 [Glycine max]KAG5091029.1 hypothetical protein JHK82_049807 [Glycine max]KAG5094131.1 hypothetical protein JHK84_049719 [Glycine max]